MENGPIIVAALTSFAILIVFTGIWWRGRAGDPVEARLAEYGATADVAAPAPRTGRRLLVSGSGTGGLSAKLADKLSKADLQLTVVEFVFFVMLVAAAGFGVAAWRGGIGLALLVGAVFLVLPFLYVNRRANKRREAFTNQLPDVLTLMIGALKAGYGITQTISMLVDRLPQPSSTEFARAMRAISLGLPVTKALNDMADRVGSDDLYLVVTAMNVQQELGGNLAQILETIADTIRERIRIKREIRVLTAQQRITGIILALLPIAAVLIIGTLNPDYMSNLFTTVIGRIMIAIALVMQFLGWLVIRKIVDIQV